MRTRRSPLTLLLVAGLLALRLARARAEPPPADEWPVERNAQLLSPGALKLGLFGVEAGVHRRLQLGTLWPTWLLGGPNLHLKALLWERGSARLSAELAFLHVNLSHLAWYGLDDLRGRVTVLPLELYLDVQTSPRLLLGFGSGLAITHGSPRYDPKQIRGAVAYDTWLARAQLTARVAPRLWLVGELDWVLYQFAGAVGAVDTQLTPELHVSGRASALVRPIAPLRGGALLLSGVLRARRLGLRLGVGYGHFAVPRVGFVSPVPIPFAVFDVFARLPGRSE